VEDAPSVIQSVKTVGFPTLAVANTYAIVRLTDANWAVKSLRIDEVNKVLPELRTGID
jgi:hypothetical protein